MVIVNRQLSVCIRKCLLLLIVFQVVYTSNILFRVHCRVNSGGKVKRYDITTIMRPDIEKLYFSKRNVLLYLRQFLQRTGKLSTIQYVLLCFYTVQMYIYLYYFISVLPLYVFTVITTFYRLHKHFYYLFYYDPLTRQWSFIQFYYIRVVFTFSGSVTA